jgi:hypothetical protein
LVWYKIPEPNRKSLDIKGHASLLLSYLPDRKGFCLWDLEKCSVVKSRDVLFEDTTFPYGAQLKQTPEPVSIEITWPKPSNETPAVTDHPQSVEVPSTTPAINNDVPLDIPLAPRFDRRLAASICAPHNCPQDPLPIASDSSHIPIPISPDSDSDSTYNTPAPSASTTPPDVTVISLPLPLQCLLVHPPRHLHLGPLITNTFPTCYPATLQLLLMSP